MSNLTGHIIGYDPGGNGKHGFAALRVDRGEPKSLSTKKLYDAEGVLSHIEHTGRDLIALGIDTMTCWCTGESGLRPADEWLDENYSGNSVVSPNGMYGSMGINGMAVVFEVRNDSTLGDGTGNPPVTETHPKVLYQEVWGVGNGFPEYGDVPKMNAALEDELGLPVEADSDHEWDAAVSTLGALRGLTGAWGFDLHHDLDREPDGRLVKPSGETHYFWPEEGAQQ